MQRMKMMQTMHVRPVQVGAVMKRVIVVLVMHKMRRR